MSVTRYAVKQALLAPRSAYRRRKETDPAARAMLEQFGFSRAMYAFIRASAEKPDLLQDLDLDRDSIVVDAGGYVGEWTERIVERYGCHVHVFEPNPRAFGKLTKRVGHRSEVTPHAFGLGAADTVVTLTLEGPGSNAFAAQSDCETVDVQVRDVVGMLEELGLDHVDCLKVNIEGGEYDLFDRLEEAGWLPRLGWISVQFHEWHPDAYRRRRRNRRAFARSHDEVWTYPWVWELWRAKER